MKLTSWFIAGVMSVASTLACADSFEIPAANAIVGASKALGTSNPVLILGDGTGSASCTTGYFLLGNTNDDFAKSALSLISTARTVNGSIFVDFDSTTCEVVNIMLTQVVSPS